MKKIKLIVFDGDGTSWHYSNVNAFGSSWDAISLALGRYREAKEMLKFYYGKPELYGEWAKKQAALFKGEPVRKAEEGMYPVPYTKGFVDFITYARRKIRRGLLTTGLNIPARRVQEQLGLDFCVCNELCSKDGRFTGEFADNVPLWEKERVLYVFLRALRIKASEVCYVGDTKGDIPCLKAAGIGVVFNPKDDEVRRAVRSPDLEIRDHRDLIKLLGI